MSPDSSDTGTPLSRPHPQFIAGLIGVAALVLGVGAALRPPIRQAVTTAVPTNELATLPERSQRRALRDMAEYVRDRATTFGKSVVYLPEYQTSALALAPNSLLTVVVSDTTALRRGTSPAVRIRVTQPSPGDSGLQAAPILDTDTLPARWGLIVARTADGRTLSLAGLTGGLIQTFCGDLGFRELVFDAPVPLAFRGGGLFDLDGNAMAQAVPCSGRVALVPLSDLIWALKLQSTTEPE
jgi:hypothetical protein